MTDEQDRAAVLQVFRDLVRFMLVGDSASLSSWLEDNFSLTHMTGYQQPKNEWLAEMRAGQFRYHSIDEGDVAIVVDGLEATLSARTTTDATVYDHRATWRLALELRCVNVQGTWRPMQTVATTW